MATEDRLLADSIVMCVRVRLCVYVSLGFRFRWRPKMVYWVIKWLGVFSCMGVRVRVCVCV